MTVAFWAGERAVVKGGGRGGVLFNAGFGAEVGGVWASASLGDEEAPEERLKLSVVEDGALEADVDVVELCRLVVGGGEDVVVVAG